MLTLSETYLSTIAYYATGEAEAQAPTGPAFELDLDEAATLLRGELAQPGAHLDRVAAGLRLRRTNGSGVTTRTLTVSGAGPDLDRLAAILPH